MNPDPAAIRQQLAAILANERFQASQRSRGLLAFLVEEALAGRGERLKGFYIACEFLGRGAEFDPLIDPIVRIEMGKLRRALELYYLSEGLRDAFRIEIPKGNYQPRFVAPGAEKPAAVPAVGDGQPLLGRASLVIRCAAADAQPGSADFALGLAQQLAARLDRLDDVYVLAGDGDEASGARFVLSASVRSQSARVRVGVRLDDRLRGLQVWADSMTEQDEDLFALEDALAQRIAHLIADPNTGQMFVALGAAVADRAQPSPEERVARFNTDHMRRLNDPAWQQEARAGLAALVREQPAFAAARAAMAKALNDAFLLGEVDVSAMQEALAHAREALRLEPESQHSLAALTNACIALGEHDMALQAIERSLQQNAPGSSARALAAVKLIMLGEAERAEQLLADCEQHGGTLAPMLAVGRALLAWLRGEHAQALAAVSRDMLARSFWGGLVLVLSLAETGELEAARRALPAVLESNPAFARDPQRFLAVSLYRQDWREKLAATLAKLDIAAAAS